MKGILIKFRVSNEGLSDYQSRRKKTFLNYLNFLSPTVAHLEVKRRHFFVYLWSKLEIMPAVKIICLSGIRSRSHCNCFVDLIKVKGEVEKLSLKSTK